MWDVVGMIFVQFDEKLVKSNKNMGIPNFEYVGAGVIPVSSYKNI